MTKSKILAMLLTLIMVLSMLPAAAFAEEANATDFEPYTISIDITKIVEVSEFNETPPAETFRFAIYKANEDNLNSIEVNNNTITTNYSGTTKMQIIVDSPAEEDMLKPGFYLYEVDDSVLNSGWEYSKQQYYIKYNDNTEDNTEKWEIYGPYTTVIVGNINPDTNIAPSFGQVGQVGQDIGDLLNEPLNNASFTNKFEIIGIEDEDDDDDDWWFFFPPRDNNNDNDNDNGNDKDNGKDNGTATDTNPNTGAVSYDGLWVAVGGVTLLGLAVLLGKKASRSK